MFRYVKGDGQEVQKRWAAKGLASLRPTMPFVAVRRVLQEMAVVLPLQRRTSVHRIRLPPRSLHQSERIYENPYRISDL